MCHNCWTDGHTLINLLKNVAPWNVVNFVLLRICSSGHEVNVSKIWFKFSLSFPTAFETAFWGQKATRLHRASKQNATRYVLQEGTTIGLYIILFKPAGCRSSSLLVGLLRWEGTMYPWLQHASTLELMSSAELQRHLQLTIFWSTDPIIQVGRHAHPSMHCGNWRPAVLS